MEKLIQKAEESLYKKRDARKSSLKTTQHGKILINAFHNPIIHSLNKTISCLNTMPPSSRKKLNSNSTTHKRNASILFVARNKKAISNAAHIASRSEFIQSPVERVDSNYQQSNNTVSIDQEINNSSILEDRFTTEDYKLVIKLLTQKILSFKVMF